MQLRNSRLRRSARACAVASTLVIGLVHTGSALAQAILAQRVIQVGDTRQLSEQAQATLTEGAKSADARTRVLAMRAAGRFETPALLDLILPLLSDPIAEVRQAAAVAAASSARLFTGRAIEALLQALPKAADADWAVFAASVGRILTATPEQYRAVEHALAASLPVVQMRAQVVRPSSSGLRAVDPTRLEGAARGLEALTRISGKVATLSPDTRSRLVALVESGAETNGTPTARARRLALQALRNARAIDGSLARAAAKDPDDEVRRLAVVAAGAAITPEAGATIEPADRDAVLTTGLKDAEPRVRFEAVRGWNRHLQATDCQPVIAAAKDPNAHVSLQAIDALGSGCAAQAPAVSLLLQAHAEALPPSGSDWHRAAHAIVSLAKASPRDVRTLLPRFVGHPTWQVRMYAARAAGHTQTIEALTRLGADAHDNVREAALEELARLKRPEALAVAYDALGRPDHQLLMTAARALEAETDKPKATRALLTALTRLTSGGTDNARDPRVALVTRLVETGSAADASALAPYLNDYDVRVAELAAKALSTWTGTPHVAATRLRPVPPLDVAALDAVRTKRVRVTMARGGTMELRLLPDDAPATVLRVASLAAKGYYNGLTFHRVEPTFVLQGGSPGANEYVGDAMFMRDEPGLAHNRGTIGISTRGRDTGDAQIFVNLVDSPRLDHAYTVFAVIERGLDVADAVLEGDVMTRVELVDGPRR